MNNTFWNLLFIGDVVAQAGCDKLKAALPALKREKQIDICIANGENSAQGNGMTPDSAEQLFSAGVDFITGGNHTFRRREIYDYLDNSLSVCRPANYKSDCPGRGFAVLDKGFVRVGVVNVLGTVYLEPLRNPFDCVDEAIAAYTVEAAKASGQGADKGTLSRGKLADFVALETHPGNVAADEIAKIPVKATILGGHYTHQSP